MRHDTALPMTVTGAFNFAWQRIYLIIISCGLRSSKWLIRALIFDITVKFLTLVCVIRLIKTLEIAVKPRCRFYQNDVSRQAMNELTFSSCLFHQHITANESNCRHCYRLSSLLPPVVIVTACRHCCRLSSLLPPVIIVNACRHCCRLSSLLPPVIIVAACRHCCRLSSLLQSVFRCYGLSSLIPIVVIVTVCHHCYSLFFVATACRH